MTHLVTQPTPPFLVCGGSLEVHQIPAWRDNFIWLLRCTQTNTIAVVDGPEVSPVDAVLAKHGWTLSMVLNTHIHPDHIGINRELAQLGRLSSLQVAGPANGVPGLTDPVTEGSTVHVGNVAGTVLLTEGHLDGHVSYLFSDVLFCGDTLFAGGCGRLFDGPPNKMWQSLKRLSALPAETLVCCAHEYTRDNLRFAATVDPDNADLAQRIAEVDQQRSQGGSTLPSTIGLERLTNPFLRPEAVRPYVERQTSQTLKDHTAVFAATRSLKDAF